MCALMTPSTGCAAAGYLSIPEASRSDLLVVCIVNMVHAMPVLVVGFDGVQHGLSSRHLLDEAFEQGQGNNL